MANVVATLVYFSILSKKEKGVGDWGRDYETLKMSQSGPKVTAYANVKNAGSLHQTYCSSTAKLQCTLIGTCRFKRHFFFVIVAITSKQWLSKTSNVSEHLKKLLRKSLWRLYGYLYIWLQKLWLLCVWADAGSHYGALLMPILSSTKGRCN